jgi:biotin synthase-related radical SAM superfamily protein
MNKQQLITDLQTNGLRLVEETGAAGRKGGAGPSDHKAVTVEGTTVMVPIYTGTAARSPYTATLDSVADQVILHCNDEAIAPIVFPQTPKFYKLTCCIAGMC